MTKLSSIEYTVYDTAVHDNLPDLCTAIRVEIAHGRKVLVWARTDRECRNLVVMLGEHSPLWATSDMDEQQRESEIGNFRLDVFPVLIATKGTVTA